MCADVTFTLDAESVEAAKRYAEKRGLQLSDLATAFFKRLEEEEREEWLNSLSPKLRRLHGAIKLPPELQDKDYKDIISDVLWEKYISLG